jgi:XTP/dITP diphosphohydrolase
LRPAHKRIVLASGNPGKAREFGSLLRELHGTDIELVLQSELNIASAEESGATFADNALLKARHAAALSGLPALADDSGLEVDALDGAPGVRSARYAGENATDQDNVRKLLADLQGVPAARRSGRFCCVLAFVRNADDPEPVLASGQWEGLIAFQPRGSGGFGYDPVFIDAGTGRTAAELTADEKNARSHRGKALAQLRSMLAGKL